MDPRFSIETPLVQLAVAVRAGMVVAIDLNRSGCRDPETPFERRVAMQLHAYLAGRRHQFDFPIAPHGSPFDQQVWHALQAIPYGETRTYGEVARSIGRPQGARAVGRANGRNPIPLVIPCHRVVAAGGRLGGYGGGLDLKRRLLDLETRHTVLLDAQA